MEPLIEVADEELPPEARALLDPAVPIPEDVEFYVAYQPPRGTGAVTWWLIFLVLLSLSLVFGLELPQAIASEYTIEKVFGFGFPLLCLWGAFLCFKRARQTGVEAVRHRRGSWRQGLFLAPDFVLFGRGERLSFLHRSQVLAVRRRDVGFIHSGPRHFEEIKFAADSGKPGGWIRVPALKAIQSREPQVALIAHWAGFQGGFQGGGMGDTYYWSPSADNDPAPWLIHVFEQDLPDEARELLKGYIPLPDDVRFFVLPPWWLISNAAIYWLFILTPLSLGVGIMLKVVEIISVEGLQSGFGLVAASLVFFAMAYGVFRLAMPTHVDLAKRRRGEWRRGLFLGAEQMLYCTENNSGDRRVRVTWLHRSEVHTVRVRNRRSFGNLLLQPVAQLGCSRDGGESIHWFELLRPLAAVKPGPDLVMLWAEWAGLKGKLVPSEMRGDWDWESTAPSAE